jgi:putative ABC transport system permease protein
MKAIWMESRTALRALLRSPGFTVTAVAMLGAGLGLTMYMFGAINAFLLRPLPFARAERIAHVELHDPTGARRSVEIQAHDVLDLERYQTSLADFAAYTIGTLNLSGDERPERYEGGYVSARLFRLLGVAPTLGRDFSEADYVPGAPAVVMLGHALWQQRYQGDAAIVGRTVRVGGAPATVIGVMPPGFQFPQRQEVWAPAPVQVSDIGRGHAWSFEVVGRLKPGVGHDAVAAEYDALLERIGREHPDSAAAGMRAVVKPLSDEYVSDQTRSVLGAMMAAVVFVLLIACANVANLMTARTLERTRELAIHAALGADRRRLLLRVVGEGVLIAAIGGALGFGLAQWGGAATMRVLAEDGIPYWMQYRIDWRSLVFACALAFAAALLATLVPALRAARRAEAQGMREGGHGSAGAGVGLGRLSRMLIAGEIALCAVLLVAAGLTVRSIQAMHSVEIGADTRGVLTARIALGESQYADDAAVHAFFEQLESRLAALPGTQGATVSTSMPATFAGGTWYLTEGAPAPADQRFPFAYSVAATPSYFGTFGIDLRRGRLFDQRDRAGTTPVVVVTEALAQAAWPGQEALGKRLDLDPQSSEDPLVEVIGVVGNVRQDEPDDATAGVLYRPFAQAPQRYASVAVRSAGDAYALADALRATVAVLDADLPVYFVRSIDDWIAAQTIPDRLMAKLFSLFAGFGVLLAAAGIYALLAYSVARRTREIGVRRALGAGDRGIVRLVLRQGARQLAIGLGIGLVLAVGFAQVLSRVLFGVSTLDPPTFVTVAAVLALVVVLASWLPARRALRVEPIQALRYE